MVIWTFLECSTNAKSCYLATGPSVNHSIQRLTNTIPPELRGTHVTEQ